MPAQITPLSAPPTRADPVSFPERADTFLSELPTLAVEMNAAILEINDNALTASAAKDIAILKRNETVAAASAASDSAASASSSATAASDSAASASSSAAFASESARLLLGAKSAPPTVDNDGNPLILGMRYYDTTTGKERVYGNTGWEDGISAVAGVSSFNGITGAVEVPPASLLEMEAGTETNLRLMTPEGVRTTALAVISTLSKQSIDYEARTSATPLVSGDATKWISFTSGSFTQTFTDAASLKAGWWAILGNSSSGDIRLQPNGVETIDGLTSYIMYPGEVRLVQCDGSTLRTVVLNAFYKTFTASGAFTKPPGYSAFQGLLWAGGAAGFLGTGPGGGGGACAPFDYLASALSTTESVVIGSGGTANYAQGGNSSFKNTFAYGGYCSNTVSRGGGILSAATEAAAGGPQLAAGGTYEIYGGANSNAISLVIYGGSACQASNSSGGNTLWGGAAGGGSGAGALILGGVSKYGGSGGQSTGAVGSDGRAPGGGGGAGTTTRGVGGRGELRIWGVI